MKTLKYQILPFDKKYDKKEFSCGIEALDRYITQQAGQDKRRSVTATYVISEENRNAVLGYYTLSATSILLTDLPEKIIKKLPRYPTIPATLLGRLAVDSKYQGNKLGELLLVDALKRSLDISKSIASFSLVVNAKTDSAIEFYKRYGFIQFPSYKNRLFLPMATIAQAFSEKKTEISKATFDVTPTEYKKIKGLKREDLRDHITDLELIFSMLGEAATTEITRDEE